MTLPHTLIGGFQVAPFKTPSKEPYGAYANTTPSGKYPVKQTITLHKQTLRFTWPSSEHAYHAQKILHLKAKLPDNHPLQQTLTDALKTVEQHQGDRRTNEFLPRDHWDPIIANMVTANRMAFNNLLRDENITPANTGNAQKDAIADFSILADANYHSLRAPKAGINPATKEPWTKGFMRTVIELKLETNPKLKGLAMQMAREGIMPIEFSQHDVNWASGREGNGANMLGIILLEIGNGLLLSQGETPAIPNPNAHYEALKTAHQAELSHDRLIPKETHTPISRPSVTSSSQSSILDSLKQRFFGQPAPVTPTHSSIHREISCFSNKERNQRLTVDNGQVIKAERKENGLWTEIYKEECDKTLYYYDNQAAYFDGHTLTNTNTKNLSP